MLVLCSRNARPEKGLVRRPHVDQHGCPSQRSESKQAWKDHFYMTFLPGSPPIPPLSPFAQVPLVSLLFHLAVHSHLTL